jgi:hypothetical protein
MGNLIPGLLCVSLLCLLWSMIRGIRKIDQIFFELTGKDVSFFRFWTWKNI